MATYPLGKPGNILFQDSAFEVNYACENNNYEYYNEDEQNGKFLNQFLAEIHVLLPFYLIISRGPIIIVKRY